MNGHRAKDWREPENWAPPTIAIAGGACLALAIWALHDQQSATAITFGLFGIGALLVAPNINRLKSFNFSPKQLRVTLTSLPAARAPEVAENIAVNFVTADAANSPSYVGALVDVLIRPDAVGYVEIDLGRGREWLTSRLFVLTALLSRTRQAQAVIFVDASGGTRHYVGMADIHAVRWGLSRAYPLFEAALAGALSRVFRAYWPMTQPGWTDALPVAQLPGQVEMIFDVYAPKIGSFTGAFDPPAKVGEVVYDCLSSLRVLWPPPEVPPPDGWVALERSREMGGGTYWEYAHWLDTASAQQIFEPILENKAVIEGQNGAVNLDEVLQWRYGIVPVVDNRGKLVKAIDRLATVRDQGSMPGPNTAKPRKKPPSGPR